MMCGRCLRMLGCSTGEALKCTSTAPRFEGCSLGCCVKVLIRIFIFCVVSLIFLFSKMAFIFLFNKYSSNKNF